MLCACRICVLLYFHRNEAHTSNKMSGNLEVNAAVSVSDVLVDDKQGGKEFGREIANNSQPSGSSEESVAPAGEFWTVKRDGAVKLRVGSTEHDSETPITVHELFKRTVERARDYFALAVKRKDQWQKWTYDEYMRDCRIAAKGFIKVKGFLIVIYRR